MTSFAPVSVLLGITGTLLALAVGYLLWISGAAAYRSNRNARLRSVDGTAPVSPHGYQRTTVIIPAHNEEPVIAATIRSLLAQESPTTDYTVLVIADNCTDRTAEIARDLGATVWERSNLQERGKGYALAWAVERLLALPEPADAYVIVDADTVAAPDFLRELISALWKRQDRHGRAVVQGRYGVLNEQEGWRAALMAAAFDLVNHVRPLGLDTLGFSVDLKGNGMAFSRPVFAVAPWSGKSITEDLDYGLDLLVNHGIVVGYAPDAKVRAQMPTDPAAAASQRDRWEKGRRLLIRERAVPLLLAGLRTGDRLKFEVGVRLLVPPLVELATLCVLWSLSVAVALRFGLTGNFWAFAAVLLPLGLAVYLVTGLRTAGATPEAFTALLYAPAYLFWKLARYVVAPRGAKSLEWVRTERNKPKEMPLPR